MVPQPNHHQLPERYRLIVAQLERQFGAVAHDLWQDDKLNVAPARKAFVRKLRGRDLECLSNEAIDYIAFTALTTMGGVPTLKFILPRFFAAYFAERRAGWLVDPVCLMDKYKMAETDAWPNEEQRAALEALAAFVECEREIAVEDAESWCGEIDREYGDELQAVTDWVSK